jgi:hypothetical protein
MKYDASTGGVSLSTTTPLRAPLENRIAALVDVLRTTADLTPFAILNAVYGCDLSVYEIGATKLDALVDEVRAQRSVGCHFVALGERRGRDRYEDDNCGDRMNSFAAEHAAWRLKALGDELSSDARNLALGVERSDRDDLARRAASIRRLTLGVEKATLAFLAALDEQPQPAGRPNA